MGGFELPSLGTGHGNELMVREGERGGNTTAIRRPGGDGGGGSGEVVRGSGAGRQRRGSVEGDSVWGGGVGGAPDGKA